MKKPIPFGKYLLLERINVGGMAEVFKAKAFGVEGFERLVAVKRILPSIAEDTEFITMFIDEAKIAVQLTHANIAQIFDLGKVSESYFIAMEYVHGKDLRAIFDRARKKGEPLPIPMSCYVMMKVCEGLDYAHNKKDPSGKGLNLVHRDVSPQNVLISYDGECKIIDFGIAKAAGKAGKTQAGILKGKFGYMSPEQVRGLPLDRRSDVFAVGICLYELLTGERLFVGESDFSTLEKVRNVEIMPPSTYNRKVPEELERIVLKALAQDVDDRYQTAMDLHDDLQSFMYTSGNFFARKDLGGYMGTVFQEEIAKESARDEVYRRLEAPPELGSEPPGRAEDSSSEDNDTSSTTAAGKSARARAHSAGGQVRSGASTPPPVPPGGASKPPPPPGAGPALAMDWDDEELSTQIYDKPEDKKGGSRPSTPSPVASGAMGHGSMPSPASAPPRPLSTPPGAGAVAARPRSVAPAVGVPAPHRPRTATPGTSPGFDPTYGSAGPSARPAAASHSQRPSAPHPGQGAGAGQTGPIGQTAVTTETAVTQAPTAQSANKRLLVVAAIGVLSVLLVLVGPSLFAKEKPGTIQFRTRPHDAVVLFDDEPLDATASPYIISGVEPDLSHLITVRKEGFKSWSARVRVTAEQTLELPEVVLVPEASALQGSGFVLTSTPVGAKVSVDGNAVGRTPVQVTDLGPGKHVIEVSQGARFQTHRQEIEVEANRILELPEVKLQLAKVTVHFESRPTGSSVTLEREGERRYVGNTPTSADVDITGEPFKVYVRREGHNTYSEVLKVPAGKDEYTFSARLDRATRGRSHSGSNDSRPEPTDEPSDQGGRDEPSDTGSTRAASGSGNLMINTRPWSQVFVDGQLIGNTPQRNIPLSAGRHQVTLVNSEYNIRRNVTVNIKAGETEKVILTLSPDE